jgi:hypothetical protein
LIRGKKRRRVYDSNKKKKVDGVQKGFCDVFVRI